jgi:site-specific DNA-cytosine methylase
MARILMACEESQAVTKAFRALGHQAFSCDLQACSGGHPEWHIQGDVQDVLAQDWDCVIAFPPCTHLAASGAAWFEQKRADGRQQSAIDFFMLFANCRARRWAIENPVGVMSTHYRKPDQIIHPWQFGHQARKKTCLWLKDLPKLVATNIVDQGELVTYASGCVMPKWYADAWRLPPAERSKVRSKTFEGIAQAMANPWRKAIESDK